MIYRAVESHPVFHLRLAVPVPHLRLKEELESDLNIRQLI
jgi:hypothetical protein